MNYNAQDLVDMASHRLFGTHSDDASTFEPLLLAFANEAQADMANRIRSRYSEQAVSMSTVADQETYNIPAPYRYGGMNRLYVDDQEYQAIGPIDFLAEKYDYMYTVNALGTTYSLFPIPETTDTDNIDLYFQKYVPALQLGTATAGALTSITLSSDAPNTDDVLNNTYLEITGGTGAGQLVLITDYNGTTKVATCVFTEAPDNTTTYATLPPFPEQMRPALVEKIIALYRLREMQDDEAQMAEQRYERAIFEAMGQTGEFQQRPKQIKLYNG